MALYNYDVQLDITAKAVSANSLHAEIVASTVTIALNGVAVAGDDVEIDFKASLPPVDKSVLDQLVLDHTGVPPVEIVAPTTADGRPRVQIDAPEGSSFTKFSINWCDKTTWFPESIKVEAATMLTTGDPLVFTFADVGGAAKTHVINVTNAKITQEIQLVSDYAPVVSVGAVVQVEREVFYDAAVTAADGRTMTAGDYTIDYAAGTISFFNTPASTPVADRFHYAYGSGWLVTPLPGHRVDMIAMEVSLSNDVVPTDTVRVAFQMLAIAASAAGFLPASQLVSEGGPIPDLSYIDIPVGIREYPTLEDFINEAQRNYPAYVANANPRGCVAQCLMRWPYSEEAKQSISSTQGMRLRVHLKYDQPFGGAKAVASLYSVSEVEAA